MEFYIYIFFFFIIVIPTRTCQRNVSYHEFKKYFINNSVSFNFFTYFSVLQTLILGHETELSLNFKMLIYFFSNSKILINQQFEMNAKIYCNIYQDCTTLKILRIWNKNLNAWSVLKMYELW